MLHAGGEQRRLHITHLLLLTLSRPKAEETTYSKYLCRFEGHNNESARLVYEDFAYEQLPRNNDSVNPRTTKVGKGMVKELGKDVEPLV